MICYCKSKTTEINTKLRVDKTTYKGKVWCINTNYGTFIARRNNKVFITGNCMGHDHQRGAWPTSCLVPSFRRGKDQDEVELKQKRQFLCRSGSFKRAYVDNTIGYEIGRVLRPADLGALRLDIGFHRDRKDGNDIMITDITAIT